MSALPPEADVPSARARCRLSANSGPIYRRETLTLDFRHPRELLPFRARGYLATLFHFMRNCLCWKPRRKEAGDGTHTLQR